MWRWVRNVIAYILLYGRGHHDRFVHKLTKHSKKRHRWERPEGITEELDEVVAMPETTREENHFVGFTKEGHLASFHIGREENTQEHAGLHGAGIQNIYSSGCSNDRINLECPDNHKIAIKRLFYGVKNDTNCAGKGKSYSRDCCRPTHSDCLVVDDTKYPFLNMLCSGHRGCDIEAKSIASGTTCEGSGYGAATDYMSVIHDCIPDARISSLCSDSHKKGKLLYLSNKHYPYPISSGRKNCKCLIKTGRHVGLDIHALDIIITRSDVGNECNQNIEITDDDGYQKQITCGHPGLYGFRNIYNRDVRSVTLTLNSFTNQSQGYVWIQTKASDAGDFVEVFCGKAMGKLLGYDPVEDAESRTINNEPEVKIPIPIPDLEVVSNSNKTQQGSSNNVSDMVALIAGIAVAVAMIIIIGMIGIIILCVRRAQQKRNERAMRAFPSPMSGGKKNQMSNSYCKYDYDEDKYCSIKRSPMRMTKFSNMDMSADQKLKEAFLEGVAPPEGTNENTYTNYPQQQETQQSTYQNTPLVNNRDDTDSTRPDFNENNVEKTEYVTMGTPVQPRSVMREITVSTLPEKRKLKNKTVTFSPVAMVTPLPSGSDEIVSEDTVDDLKANFLDLYSKSLPLRSSTGRHPSPDKPKKVMIVQGTKDDSYLTTFQSPGCENVTEEDLWKAFHIKLDNDEPEPEEEPLPPPIPDNEDFIDDENPYDNLPYVNTDSLRHQIADTYKDQLLSKDSQRDTFKRNCSQRPTIESIPEV